MRILLTGAAGFIGFHTATALLARGDEVIGFDNLNDYYDPKLKNARLEQLKEMKGFQFIHGDLCDPKALDHAFELLSAAPDQPFNHSTIQPFNHSTRVCHLAAAAGVRYSMECPQEFIRSNIAGFTEVIERCQKHTVGGLIYASTSSIYGDNKETPFRESDRTDNQVSLYGVTKKENELQAHVTHKMCGLPVTGLRFFTVYGPWGRPDMALFLFTEKLLKGEPLPIFGKGKMQRDFTYVDDIVSGIVAAIDKNYPEEVFNLGCGKTEELMDYVTAIEKACGKEATKEFLPMQPGDVVATSADITKAKKMLSFEPKTTIAKGVPRFVEWYRNYYNI